MDARKFASGNSYTGKSLHGQPIVTVSAVAEKTMEDGSEKLVLKFTDGKSLTVNSTNCNTLISLFGTDTNSWIGQSVQLFRVETTMGPGVRIQQTPQQPPPPPAPVAPPAVTAAGATSAAAATSLTRASAPPAVTAGSLGVCAPPVAARAAGELLLAGLTEKRRPAKPHLLSDLSLARLQIVCVERRTAGRL